MAGGRRPGSDEASAEARRKLEELFGGKGDGTKPGGESRPAGPPAPGGGPRPSGRPSGGGRVFASPRKSMGRGPSEYRMRLERLRIAREPEEIREAADQFLAQHQLPDDVDILYKVLLHPAEKVVRDALGQLSSLLTQGRLSGTLLLEDRLKDLGARVTEPATRSYVEGLQMQLRGLKGGG